MTATCEPMTTLPTPLARARAAASRRRRAVVVTAPDGGPPLDRRITRRLRDREDANCSAVHQACGGDIFAIVKLYRLLTRRRARGLPIAYGAVPERLLARVPSETFVEVALCVDGDAGARVVAYRPFVSRPDDDAAERRLRAAHYRAQFECVLRRYGVFDAGDAAHRRGPLATPVRIVEHPEFTFKSARKAAKAMRDLGHAKTQRSDIRNAIKHRQTHGRGGTCCGFHWEYADDAPAQLVLRHDRGVGYTRAQLSRLAALRDASAARDSYPLFAKLGRTG
jgi:hypothetical protein